MASRTLLAMHPALVPYLLNAARCARRDGENWTVNRTPHGAWSSGPGLPVRGTPRYYSVTPFGDIDAVSQGVRQRIARVVNDEITLLLQSAGRV
jgi:hypothetical protein